MVLMKTRCEKHYKTFGTAQKIKLKEFNKKLLSPESDFNR
jgi:hypothetical protein